VLAVYLARLGWSPERLAGEVNRACGSGTISRKAPYGWLKGSCPRGQLPHVVAGILTERLGELVAAEELWPKAALRPSPETDGDGLEGPWTQDGLDQIGGALARRGLDGAGGLWRGRRPYPADRLVGDVLAWSAAPARPLRPRRQGMPVTPEVLAGLEARLRQLRDLDGAGQDASLVARWTCHDLHWAVHLTAAGAFDRRTGMRLHGLVAQMAGLAGWSAFEAGQDAVAQRCWLLALRSAHASGDRLLCADIVSCLSNQLRWAGHAGEALRLAEVAVDSLGALEPTSVHALARLRLARAHALLGSERDCRQALERAAADRADRDPAADPEWAGWVGSAVTTADTGRAHLDLRNAGQAEVSLAAALRALGSARPRNRMLHQASLAEARIQLGEMDGAAEAASAALELSAQVGSPRGQTRMRALRRALEARPSAATRDVAGRLRVLVPA